MVSGGYEYLAAADAVTAINLRHCLGTNLAEIRTTLCLCQAHRAAPDTRCQFAKIRVLLIFTTMFDERIHRAKTKAWIH